MQEEIEEILEDYKQLAGKITEKLDNTAEYESWLIIQEYFDKLYNHITNLQEELEELREDNYAYHQLMKMENEREYRSKFLKEFQEEFGKNVFPDYDEIYKRYDKLKEENKRLKEIVENLTTMTAYGDRTQIKNTAQYKLEIAQNRIDKAIEYIKKCQLGVDAMDRPYMLLDQDEGKELLNILKGDNK
jgi:DNA repair exonuclease SbcCD ATPase subunit